MTILRTVIKVCVIVSRIAPNTKRADNRLPRMNVTPGLQFLVVRAEFLCGPLRLTILNGSLFSTQIK